MKGLMRNSVGHGEEDLVHRAGCPGTHVTKVYLVYAGRLLLPEVDDIVCLPRATNSAAIIKPLHLSLYLLSFYNIMASKNYTAPKYAQSAILLI